MKCPHCLENFFVKWDCAGIRTPGGGLTDIADVDGTWALDYCSCPSCKRAVIRLRQQKKVGISGGKTKYEVVTTQLARPRGISRAPLSSEIPSEFATDYKEACLVLADSPKASAALSRRCLQALLKEKGGTTKRDLADQIQEVLDSRQLPSYLADSLDAVRNTGNFAAHPIKSTNTGEIIDVEPGEAEWNLDALEGLFDFYFVQPAKLKEKRERLNEKLQDAGKPLLKTTDS